MKRLLIAAAVLASGGMTSSAAADGCLGNCHNFVTIASTGGWMKSASGGFVHDSSLVYDIVIEFAFDSADLTAKGEQTLLDNIDILVHSGAVGFANSGFASVEGATSYNLSLSERRAAAVYNFLESSGLDMDLITPVVGYGETDQMGETLEENRIVVLSFNG